MEGTEIEVNNGALNSEIAIRCAKAAIVLSSLKSFPNHSLKIMNNVDEEEKKNMEREIQNLKIELAWERMKNRRIKLCGLMEVILHVLVLLSLSSFFLMLFVKN